MTNRPRPGCGEVLSPRRRRRRGSARPFLRGEPTGSGTLFPRPLRAEPRSPRAALTERFWVLRVRLRFRPRNRLCWSPHPLRRLHGVRGNGHRLWPQGSVRRSSPQNFRWCSTVRSAARSSEVGQGEKWGGLSLSVCPEPVPRVLGMQHGLLPTRGRSSIAEMETWSPDLAPLLSSLLPVAAIDGREGILQP